MPESLLTWHRGSILPFASLWHTVLRACALNALHPADLPTTSACPTRSVNLLSIQTSKIDVPALARALGEPPTAFAWSTLDALPAALRVALAAPQPRVCLACLASGYHSALFSIALLDVCPIHHTPLVGRCHCGAPFNAALRSLADFGTAGCCQCGRLHLFTHETCRQPTMTADMTQALIPIVAWLQSLSQLIRPSRVDEALSQHVAGSLKWLVTTAQALGVAYPACLKVTLPTSPDTVTVVYEAPSKGAPRRDRPSPTDVQENGRSSLREMESVIKVYRALARHIRRHVAPDGDLWVSRFMRSCDPVEIGELICSSGNAQKAFVAMLWACSVEPNVERRRWPYRLPSTGLNNSLAEIVAADCRLCGVDDSDTEMRHWLTFHAARVSFGALWNHAQERATCAVCLRLAAWDKAAHGTSWRDSAWLALATPFGVRFAGPTLSSWSTKPRASKTLRKAANAAREQTRHDVMWAASKGACLTWSEGDDWHVIPAIAPIDFDVRRRRLLGWKDGRPWCWLYRTADRRFVARWDHAALQVLAATPGKALTALRRCALEYQRICKIHLPCATPLSIAVPLPIEPSSSANYQFSVGAARCTEGFWRDARLLAQAARRYRTSTASRIGEQHAEPSPI